MRVKVFELSVYNTFWKKIHQDFFNHGEVKGIQQISEK